MDNERLIPDKDLEQLEKFNHELVQVIKNMGSFLDPLNEVSNGLSKAATNYKALNDLINKHEKVISDLTAEEKERVRIQGEIERLQARIISSTTKEAREVAQLRSEVQKNNRTNAISARELKAQSNSIEEQRARVARLKQEWSNMDRSLPDFTAKTTELREANKALKEMEKEVGILSRNVGNYPTEGKGGFFGAFQVFAGNILTKAVSGIAQLISKGKEFVKVGIDIAAKAEGITTAFAKLNSPDLLSNLREATRGTVSDLLLMQSAVKAENFSIPLNSLGSLLKFAQQRAQETGESIDYLTNSIINGIGRKSPLILDNLGISAVRLREKVESTGDFTQAAISIVNEELEKQGTLALTSADKAQQASVKWENAQLKLGQSFKWLRDVWNEISGNIADSISKLTGEARSAVEIYDEQIARVGDLERKTKPLAERYDELKSKVSLNKNEQAELNTIMNSIAGTVPGVVTEFDRYGNILSINTDKVYEYIQAERARLEYVNNEAIESEKEKLKWMEAQANILGKQLQTGTKQVSSLGINDNGRMGIVNERVALTAEETKNIFDQHEQLLRKIKGANQEIARLSGTSIQEQEKEYIKREQQRDAFNTMNKQQLDKWIKDTANANSEYLRLAQQVYGSRFGSTSTGSNDKTIIKTLESSHNSEKKAIRDLAEFDIKSNADAAKAIVRDQQASYVERTEALQSYLDHQKDLVETSANNQAESLIESLVSSGLGRERAEQEAQNRILLIRRNAEENLQKIELEGIEIQKSIDKDYTDYLLSEISKRANAKSEEAGISENKDLRELAFQYREGNLKTEEYEKQKTEIVRKYALERMNIEMLSLFESLHAAGITAEQRESIEEKLGQERINYQKYVNETIISDEEKAAKDREAIERQLAAKRKEILQGVIEFASALFARYTENRLQKVDEEEEIEQERADQERDRIETLEEAGAISKEESDARKAAVDAQQEKREKDLEQKRIQIQRRQAIFEKAMSATKVITDTAVAVMAAWTNPLTAPGLIPTIIATGALSLATILAQPLPQYAKGTDKHPGGLAVVGDGKKHEMVITPDGRIYKTPKTDTIIDLPAMSQVIPDFDQAIKAMAFTPTSSGSESAPVINIDINRLAALQQENVKVLKQIKSGQRLESSRRLLREILN